MSAPERRNEWAFDLVPRPTALLLMGLIAAFLLAIGVVFAPRAIAWGWLIGLLVWSSAKTLYPWAVSGAATAPDVAHFYFNVPAFAMVGLVALIGWATIGALLAAGALGLLGASIALVFHGFAVSLVAVQWALSIDPSVQQLGVRHGDRRAADHARAGRDRSRSAAPRR
jgi:hypothetical protein